MDAGTVLLVCLLSALPGPPGVSIEDAYVQLFPIDKTKCPTIDPVRDITYLLYTSENPLQPDVLSIDNDALLKNSHFDFKKPTVLFFHAFFETYTSAPATAIRTAYLQRKDHNVILLDAQRMEAGPWYITAARNTRVVGEYTAAFIDYLVSRGLVLDSLHLIGLSLGAQMAGVCGQNIKSGRIRRITGLDPAGPLFTKWPRSLKLDSGDAEFVDVIHTDAGIFGYPWKTGHVDFWPNSGLAPQPGCTIGEIKQRNPDTLLELAFCSHWRSYMFFSESVVRPESFASTSCNNWKAFARGDCDGNGATEYMGFGVSPRARGNFYLHTRERSPFSLQTPRPQADVALKNVNTALFSNVVPYEKTNQQYLSPGQYDRGVGVNQYPGETEGILLAPGQNQGNHQFQHHNLQEEVSFVPQTQVPEYNQLYPGRKEQGAGGNQVSQLLYQEIVPNYQSQQINPAHEIQGFHLILNPT